MKTNWKRALYSGVIGASLLVGAYVGGMRGVNQYFHKLDEPQVLLESVQRVERLPNGLIHMYERIERHQYLVSPEMLQQLPPKQPAQPEDSGKSFFKTVGLKVEKARIVPSRIDLEGVVVEFGHSKGLGQSHDYWGKIKMGEDDYDFGGHGRDAEKFFKEARKKQRVVYVQCYDERVDPCRVQAVK